MLRQIKVLARLSLTNLLGWNVLRNTKDPKAKRKALFMLGVYVFLIVMAAMYMGGMAYGLVTLGAGTAAPAYLIAVSSLLVFFLGTFTAGGSLFARNGYEILCSLPVSRWAIVASRFVRLYVENLALSWVILLPGLSVWFWCVRPGGAVYLACLPVLLAAPMVPVAAASLFGAVVTGISSRMKHKSLVEAVFSILLVFGVFWLTSGAAEMEGDLTPEMLAQMADKIQPLLGSVYPPAVWLGAAVARGDVLRAWLWSGASLGVLLTVAAAIGWGFHGICRRLFSSSARHDYRLGRLQSSRLWWSLCRREFRRYFASGVYVTNTIIGPIMAAALAVGVMVAGADGIRDMFPLPVDITRVIPVLLAGIFCMMTTASVSVSMEGKNFWIVKSLPLTTKMILDAKILMNLLLMLPFYLVSLVCLLIGLKPGMVDGLFLAAIPAVFMVFSCVYGVAVNLRMPVLEWESEVSVVKQSGSAMLGGMGGFLIAIACVVLLLLAPESYADMLRLGICVVLAVATMLLYRSNNRKALQEL